MQASRMLRATMIAGVLDPATGTIEFANAGHVSPLFVSQEGATELSSTDLVVGLGYIVATLA